MSHTLTLTCPQCGHTFERTYGVNVVGQATLYCDCCGKARYVDFSIGWEPLPDCDCGGHFDADAKGCCPPGQTHQNRNKLIQSAEKTRGRRF